MILKEMLKYVTAIKQFFYFFTKRKTEKNHAPYKQTTIKSLKHYKENYKRPYLSTVTLYQENSDSFISYYLNLANVFLCRQFMKKLARNKSDHISLRENIFMTIIKHKSDVYLYMEMTIFQLLPSL